MIILNRSKQVYPEGRNGSYGWLHSAEEFGYMFRLEDFGFDADEYLISFTNIFDDSNIKEIHMDTYLNEPYMLLSRVVENNVSSFIQDGRLVLRQKNGNMSVFCDILLDCIDNCMVKKYSNFHYQIVCAIQNVYYKMFVVLN